MRSEARNVGPRRVPLGEVYLGGDEIATRVAELGREIASDYARQNLLLVTVLKGAFVFAADLSRAIPAPHALDFVALAGYGGPLGGRPGIRLIKDLDLAVRGREVLVVQNVVDTGLTLNFLVRALALRDPEGLAICTLLDRPHRRLVDDLPLRYVGFTVPDEFFAGYGFDLGERHRGLRDLHVVRDP